MRRHALPAALAGAIAVTAALGAAPARAAAPPSADEAVYLVHGVQWDGGTDCRSTWRNAVGELRRHGFRGPLVTWGYYKHDTRCTRSHEGTRNTTLKELGRQLAWDIYRNHSRRGRSVAVLGHSMGGLVTAAAITGVRQYGGKSFSWPPYLRVRNAVALSSPFGGLRCVQDYVQCGDMRPGSRFLKWLASHPDPQGRKGTDWTLLAAQDDRAVPVASALSAKARHEVTYLPGQHVAHTRIRAMGGPARYRLRYSHTWGTEPRETRTGPSPLRMSARALSSSAW